MGQSRKRSADAGPAAAFVLDPDGITGTKALGSERTARKLRGALAGGNQPLHAAVWALVRPIPSQRLTALNRDAFVRDSGIASTVDLAEHRGDAGLDEFDLGDDSPEAA